MKLVVQPQLIMYTLTHAQWFFSKFMSTLIDVGDVSPIGAGLVRPECVLCDAEGRIHVSNADGGVTILHPDGRASNLVARDPPVALLPNGIALLPGGAYLLANLANEGGVWRLDPSGTVQPVVSIVDGLALPATNFVLADRPDCAWITVSTRRSPRSEGYRRDVADGFIVRTTPEATRIVADGLGYTNECQVHPDGKWLYVNETFARRLSRFAIRSAGDLGPRETVHEFGEGVFPDGLCFDSEGSAWITSIISNRVIRLGPGGEESLILQDADSAHLEWVEQAYRTHSMDRSHLDTKGGRKLGNISSLAFGGPDLKTAYLGCLLDESVYMFRSPVAGFRPQHWDW